MNAEGSAVQPRCPRCTGPLVRMPDAGGESCQPARPGRHLYWCPSGCAGSEPDGTFELISCPACGSHDTCTTPASAGLEEVECNACGTITRVQMAP
jgi:hypothetical protein